MLPEVPFLHRYSTCFVTAITHPIFKNKRAYRGQDFYIQGHRFIIKFLITLSLWLSNLSCVLMWWSGDLILDVRFPVFCYFSDFFISIFNMHVTFTHFLFLYFKHISLLYYINCTYRQTVCWLPEIISNRYCQLAPIKA